MADSKGMALNTLQTIVLFLFFPLICSAGLPPKLQLTQQTFVNFGEACNTTMVCAPDKNLACSETCDCSHPELMIFESETAKCVIADNNSCIAIAGDNPANGIASSFIVQCRMESECDPKKGICVPKLPPSKECSSTSDCEAKGVGLICKNNSCTCDPITSIKSIDSNDCLGKVEKPCVNNKCAANAECLGHPDVNDPGPKNIKNSKVESEASSSPSSSYKQVCKCLKGHFPTPSGSCSKQFGNVCNKKSPCQPWLKCGLEGLCECEDPSSQVYDEERASCVAKIFGQCNANFSNKYDREKQVICVAGGECVNNTYFVNGKRANVSGHHCRCKSGFAENDEGTCDLAYGSKCEQETVNDAAMENGRAPALQCDRKLNLVCLNGKCKCEQNLYAYDELEGKCVGLSGATCTTTAALEQYVDKDGGNMTRYTYKVEPTAATPTSNSLNRTADDNRGGCTRGAICEPIKTVNPIAGPGNGICKCIKAKQFDGSCEPKPLLLNPQICIIGSSTLLVLMVLGISCWFYTYLRKQTMVVQNALS